MYLRYRALALFVSAVVVPVVPILLRTVRQLVKAFDLYQRVVLYTVVVLQVTLVPIVGFSLTYLLEVDRENFTIAVRTELIYWIIVAAITAFHSHIIPR